MKSRDRFHPTIEGLMLGDRLISLAKNNSRYGIYAGNCQVITLRGGAVVVELLEEFAPESLYIDLRKSDFAAAEVVRRAKSQVGVNVNPWDGRRFCDWCQRGPVLAFSTE